jgi:hypothetical protein
MPKKKFSETKVGKFLIKAGSTIGVALPESGFLGVLRGLITSDSKLTPADKETALKLLDIDIAEMQEISKRWESDMKSDSFLSKNTRPLALLFLTVSMVFLIVLDSLNIDFGVSEEWIDLLKSLLITVYVAYFGSRGVEKFKAIGK